MRNTVAPLQRFGRLRVVIPEGRKKGRDGIIRGGRHALCICDCGQLSAVRISNLVYGQAKSCGCLSADTAKALATSHGMYGTPIRNRWNAMVQRCTNPSNANYGDYGGRGITVCDRWLVFELFLEDVGHPPSEQHSLDRIDNSKGYCPGNVRWATKKEQCRNRRSNVMVSWRGQVMTATQAAEAAGIPARVVLSRLRSGWSSDEALTRPVRQSRRTR